MTQLLEAVFGELGITQYLDAFLEQGFDTWETILDITESDLDALGVKLGHRRKLQRRIANFRGIAPDASLVSPTQSSVEEVKLPDAVGIKKESTTLAVARETTAVVVVTKRKYRRHPKPDENAPERPPSAYVLFSNRMREELKGRNLSFTEIAKLVGENWQNLTAAEKEPFESQAQAMKDRYLSDLAEYKKTPEYRNYQAYLQEFKAKYGSPSQDKDASKRVRISQSGPQGRASPGATPARTSRSGSGAESRKGSEPPAGKQRVGSIVSTSDSQHGASLVSPAPVGSPDETMLSPVVSNPDQPSSDRSPAVKPDPGDAPPPLAPRLSGPGDDRSRQQFGTHRHLPSLSDVFDGQALLVGVRSPNEPSSFRFPTAQPLASPYPPQLSHPAGDVHLAHHASGHPYARRPPSSPPFGHSRGPVDGPLPIHALLASKPEPPFPTHHSPQPQYHGSPFPPDQKPRFSHQTLNGASNLPMVNGASSGRSDVWSIADGGAKGYQHLSMPPYSHQQSLPHTGRIDHGFPAPQSPPGPPPPFSLGKQNPNLDGMSALLKAGEIVDRRTE